MKSLAAAVLLVLLVAIPLPGPAAQTTEADVYVAQATLDFDDKRYDEALENLRKALEIEPNHIEALYYTGLVHLARRQPEQAIPFLERARAQSPIDPAVAFQLGLSYFALEQYDRAQPILEELFRRDPIIDGLGYYVGFMRYRAKDYRGALAAFRAGRATRAEIQQLTRFYTGLALGVLGLPARAAAEVEEALRLAPGSALTGPAERLRDAIVSARQQERRLLVDVRFGAFYDSNVAVIPDPELAEPLVPLLRDRDHRSTGELFGARLEYTWLRTDTWDASVGYSFFGTLNNDLPDFNITNHLANLGAMYKSTVGTLPLQAGAQYTFDVLFLNEDEFVRRHTATLFGVLVESDRHLTQAVTRYQRKGFNEGPSPPPREEFRDADNWMAGFTHFLRFSQDRHFVKAGYQFDYDDTRGANFEYVGHRLLAGGQYTLPWWELRLKYDLDVHLRTYAHPNTLLPTTAPGSRLRRDEEITNAVRAELPLPYNLTLVGEYLSTINNSNLAVFDYKRNVVSVTLSWTY